MLAPPKEILPSHRHSCLNSSQSSIRPSSSSVCFALPCWISCWDGARSRRVVSRPLGVCSRAGQERHRDLSWRFCYHIQNHPDITSCYISKTHQNGNHSWLFGHVVEWWPAWGRVQQRCGWRRSGKTLKTWQCCWRWKDSLLLNCEGLTCSCSVVKKKHCVCLLMCSLLIHYYFIHDFMSITVMLFCFLAAHCNNLQTFKLIIVVLIILVNALDRSIWEEEQDKKWFKSI